MKMREFIKANRAELESIINRLLQAATAPSVARTTFTNRVRV